MFFVIGSQALNFYKKLKGRSPCDWDLLTPTLKKCKKVSGISIDCISSREEKEKTNLEIYNYCVSHASEKMMTPLGQALVAPIEILKVLKIGSLPIEKAKHQWDLSELDDVTLTPELEELARKREMETVNRITEQKSKFFNRYDIPRFFEHDRLHLFVSTSPAYLKILKNDHSVEVDEEKFKKISRGDQKEIIWEECFVLALERDLIPKVRSAPFMVETIVDDFFKIKTSESSALKWLGRLSVPGKLKDHPDWLAQWALTHQKELLNGFNSWWSKKIEHLSEDFWTQILE